MKTQAKSPPELQANRHQAATTWGRPVPAALLIPADTRSSRENPSLLGVTQITQHWANTIAVLIHEVLGKGCWQQQATDTVPLNFYITLCSNNHQHTIAKWKCWLSTQRPAFSHLNSITIEDSIYYEISPEHRPFTFNVFKELEFSRVIMQSVWVLEQNR